MKTNKKVGSKKNSEVKAGSSIDSKEFKAEIEMQAEKIILNRRQLNIPGDELSDWLSAEKEVKSMLLLS